MAFQFPKSAPREVWDARLISLVYIVFGIAFRKLFPGSEGFWGILKDIAIMGCCGVGATTLFLSFVSPGDREYPAKEKLRRFLLTLLVTMLLIGGALLFREDNEEGALSASSSAPSEAAGLLEPGLPEEPFVGGGDMPETMDGFPEAPPEAPPMDTTIASPAALPKAA